MSKAGSARSRRPLVLLATFAFLASACGPGGDGTSAVPEGEPASGVAADQAPAAGAGTDAGAGAPVAGTGGGVGVGPPLASATGAPGGADPVPAPGTGGEPPAEGDPGPPAGAAGPAGSCQRPVSTGSTPVVRLTDIEVGVPVVGYGQESDTDPLPMAIAATPSGGSQLAWLGTDNQVHVAELDCDDQIVGVPASFEAVDLQDLHAGSDGGVVLLTRDATNGGVDHCGNPVLCAGSSSPCRAMYLVRFDRSGNQAWERQVTNLSPDRAGYDDGARFVWWYQHHGRIAADSSGSYGAYFGTAITVANGSCVDIHQGDRMQVVGADGSLQAGHPDSFEVGCSHSWQTRIVWDARTGHYVMVCATDNGCRIAQPSPYQTVASGDCDGTLFGGDLVLASTPGYWTAWSQGGEVRLDHFTDGPSDLTISTAARSSHPHLVSYGDDQMLLAWESGSSLSAQVFDAGRGQTVGDTFTIEARDHSYQAFKPYPDGSAAYPSAGSGSTSIRIARVMPQARS